MPTLTERLKPHGIDVDRLEKCMNSKDAWGGMVHAFEYLTVLGVALAVMKEEANAA